MLLKDCVFLLLETPLVLPAQHINWSVWVTPPTVSAAATSAAVVVLPLQEAVLPPPGAVCAAAAAADVPCPVAVCCVCTWHRMPRWWTHLAGTTVVGQQSCQRTQTRSLTRCYTDLLLLGHKGNRCRMQSLFSQGSGCTQYEHGITNRQ